MQSARDMVERVLQMPEDKCNLILILLWRWWTARNKVNAGENPEPISVVTRAMCYLANAVQREPKIQANRSNRRTTSWLPPPDGVLKINTDGAFVQATKQGGWGFIVRDSTGDPVGTLCLQVPVI